MNIRNTASIVALALAASAAPLLAHHVVGVEYDTKHLVMMRGVVTEGEWRNPHVTLHVDVMKNGGTEQWAIQTLAPNVLVRQGFNQDFVKAGDAVDMTVCVAKDGEMKAVTRAIELPMRTAYIRVGGC